MRPGFYVKNGQQTNEVDCIKSAVRILRKRYGDTSTAAFSPLALKALQQAMVDEGWSRGFINRQIGRVKRMFRWGVSEAMIPVTTWQTLTAVTGLKRDKTTAREPDRIGPVDDAVVDATLPYLSAIVADMVRLPTAHWLSARRSLRDPAVRHRHLGQGLVVPSGLHKTEHFGRERIIFIGPKAQDVLRPYLLRPADACCFPSRPAEHDGGYYDARSYCHAIGRRVALINRDRQKLDAGRRRTAAPLAR